MMLVKTMQTANQYRRTYRSSQILGTRLPHNTDKDELRHGRNDACNFYNHRRIGLYDPNR